MTQPTHDEVIAWIDEEYRMSEWWDKRREKDGLCDEEDGYRASLLANRDVLERHKENPDNVLTQLYGDKEFYTEKHNACLTCRTVAFPCPTYLDIYNRIREVM